MKNRFSRIISIIVAFAMICSTMVIAPMTALAATEKVWEEVWSQTFDGDDLTDNGDGTYSIGGTNTTALEIDPETYGSDSYPNTRHAYLSTREANDYALTLTHTGWSAADIPANLTLDGTSMYKITYDWYTTATTGSNDVSRVRFNVPSDYYQISGYQGHPFISGGGAERSLTTPRNEWLKVEMLINSATKDVNVKWYKADGTTFLDITCNWGKLTVIDTFEVNGVAGGSMIDNIVVAKEVEMEVPDEPVDDGFEEVWSQTFDGDDLTDNDNGTYSIGGTNTSALEIDPETYGSDSYPNTRHAYLSTREANDYALTLTHTGYSDAIIPINAEIQPSGKYKLTYDWQTNCADTTGRYSRVWYRTLKNDGTTDYYQVSAYERKIFVSGGNWGDPWTLNTWHKVEVIFDYDTMKLSAAIYDGNGETIFTAGNIGIQGVLQQIELYGIEGGQKIDNIVIAKEVEKEVVSIVGNEITIVAKVNNPLPIAKTCDIIVVQYDNRGALADVSVTPVSVDANVVQAIEKTATATKDSDAVTLKAFIWDSLGNIYPLVEGIPMDLK